jgi:hypothetical protein
MTKANLPILENALNSLFRPTPNTKPVAKSLHTITVIVQVAEHLMSLGYLHDAAIFEAMNILKLNNRDDPYSLRAAATKQIEARFSED